MLNHTPQTIAHILNELRKMVVGQDEVIEQILVAVLAEGHALLEGVPGTAKTLMVKTLARIIGATVFAYPVYARSDAVGHDGNECFQYADIGIFPASGSDFYGHSVSRRDQPHAAENASRTARSDGRTAGDN